MARRFVSLSLLINVYAKHYGISKEQAELEIRERFEEEGSLGLYTNEEKEQIEKDERQIN